MSEVKCPQCRAGEEDIQFVEGRPHQCRICGTYQFECRPIQESDPPPVQEESFSYHRGSCPECEGRGGWYCQACGGSC